MQTGGSLLILGCALLQAGCLAEPGASTEATPVVLAAGDPPLEIEAVGVGFGQVRLQAAAPLDLALLVQVEDRQPVPHELADVLADGDFIAIVVVEAEVLTPLYELVVVGTAEGPVGLDDPPPMQFRLERAATVAVLTSVPGVRLALMDHFPTGFEVVPNVQRMSLALQGVAPSAIHAESDRQATPGGGVRQEWTSSIRGPSYVAAIAWTMNRAPAAFMGSDTFSLAVDGVRTSVAIETEPAWVGMDELRSRSLSGRGVSLVEVARSRETALPTTDPASGVSVIVVRVGP